MQQIKKIFLLQSHVENLKNILNDNVLVSAVVHSAVQASPRNELSPLPLCLDMVGQNVSLETIDTSATFDGIVGQVQINQNVDPVAATTLNPDTNCVANPVLATILAAMSAVVLSVSHLKASPNQVSSPPNQIPHAPNGASLQALLPLNQASPPPNQAPPHVSVSHSQVTENRSEDSSTKDPFPRVNALKKHPYNLHMRGCLSSGYIFGQSSRKNILSQNQVMCIVGHALDPMDVPHFMSSMEPIKIINGQFPTVSIVCEKGNFRQILCIK